MKKSILILSILIIIILCLAACGVKMPYDLSGTASVELHAYNSDSTEPFAKIIVYGEESADIVEMFSSLKLKELKYTEPSVNAYDLWFRDAGGNQVAKISLPYGPSPWVVTSGTAYQDVNRGIDLDYLAQLVDITLSTGPAPVPDSNVPEPSPSPEINPEDDNEDVSTVAPIEEPALEEFVLVEAWLPSVRTDLRYATENNFTGQVIYTFEEAWLRYGTVQKLAIEQEKLSEMGYSLLIWDAFRPIEAQWKLWEVFPDPIYVANPQNGFSSHSRGNTVDVTLVTLEGEAVEMPTEFDDFSLLADRDYSDVPEEAAQNAIILETIMTECGFKPYSGEWWHFFDVDTYPVEDSFVPG